jgi:diaminobutyrate-2-oxoglutarate transaminase
MPSFSSTRDYLSRQALTESNARSYPRRLPLVIREASGPYVVDVDGRRYFDCLSCAGTLVLGHNHPVVVDALRHHLDLGLPMQTLDLMTPVKDDFIRELMATLPASFASKARIQFCGPSGSDAVEAALKLVKTATGHRTILGFRGGYHGQTHGALALMGNVGPKREISGLMPGVQILPYPYNYRCPFGCNPCEGKCDGSGFIEQMLDDLESGIPPVAGMILEAVQGEAGAIAAPFEWLREIRRITRERHIPLILDEVQTGWGRTGSMYAFERAGIEPDVLVLSKAIGGGLPLAVVIYHESLDVWSPGAHAGTFRGNLMAMSAGLATLRFLKKHDVVSNADRMGQTLLERLRQIQAQFPWIGDVRGRGLMIGVEIVDPERCDRRRRPIPDGNRARAVQAACLARGLILELGGQAGSVLRLLPPLNITADQTESIAAIMGDAFAAANQVESTHV